MPELRFVNRYHDDPATSTPWRAARKALANARPADQLVMSFHGVPGTHAAPGRLPLRKATRQPACLRTPGAAAGHTSSPHSHALARPNGSNPHRTHAGEMVQSGVGRVDVVCRAFTSDRPNAGRNQPGSAEPSCMRAARVFTTSPPERQPGMDHRPELHHAAAPSGWLVQPDSASALADARAHALAGGAPPEKYSVFDSQRLTSKR